MQTQENKNPGQNRKPALIFGAAALLFTGIMGYEAIRENGLKNHSKQAEKKLPILSNFTNDTYHKPDKVEIALLNAQNHHYSNKIIALKEEAHQNSKRLHALQIAILSTERDKENQELEKLRKHLEEDRSETHALLHNFDALQQNIRSKEAEIANLVVTIDSLGEMIEAERKEKLSLKEDFENKLKEKEQHAALEKGSLTSAIYTLEKEQEELQEELKEHLAEINYLEGELSTLNLALMDKDLEKDSLTEELKLKKANLSHQVKNLSFVIETEHLAVEHIQKELHYKEAEFASLQKAFADSLENTSLITVHDLHVLAIHEDLERTLLENVQKKQTELKQLKNVHNSLQHDRNALKNLIEEKNQKILALEEQNEQLDQLVKLKASKLDEMKELAGIKQQSNEELESLVRFYEEKLASLEGAYLEKTSLNETLLAGMEKLKIALSEKESMVQIDEINAEIMQAKLNDLERFLEIRENELLLTQEAFENKRLSEKEFADSLEMAKQAGATFKERSTFLEMELAAKEEELKNNYFISDSLNQKLNELQNLLTSKEDEIKEHKNLIAAHHHEKEQLTALMLSYEGKMADLERNHTHTLSLNEETKQELDRYRQALDEALTLHEKERLAGMDLEAKLEKLDTLLNEKEQELNYAKSIGDNQMQINAELVQQIEERQQAFKQALAHYEEAKTQAVKNEGELHHLTALLLTRENEILEIKNRVAETEKSNQMLALEVETHQAGLNLSLEQKRLAEQKAEEVERQLASLFDILKEREEQLLEAKTVSVQEKLENERLAAEMERYSKELEDALAKYQTVQQKTEENNLQLNALIEKLINRETDLLKALEEETIKHAGFESDLERLDQSRQSLLSELDKSRSNYASLLNGLNEGVGVAKMLKSHIVMPGDTLRGLSLRYYGSPNRWKEIYHANQATIKNQDQIPVGTKLTIP